jgi:hypothetical protein
MELLTSHSVWHKQAAHSQTYPPPSWEDRDRLTICGDTHQYPQTLQQCTKNDNRENET